MPGQRTKKPILPKEIYLTITGESNALDCLEQAHHYIGQVERNPLAWKWVILTLHGALYGFAISVCRGTSPDHVTYQTKKGRRLISFDQALSRCQDPHHKGMLLYGQPLKLTKQQRQSISDLKNLFRNQFEHFIPTFLGIEVHGFPQMALDVLDVIRFLALESGTYIDLSLSQSQKKKIKSLVFQSKRLLKGGKLYKEAKIAEGMAAQAGPPPERLHASLAIEDLGRLRELALEEHEDFFKRNPRYQAAYHDALIGVCLCQGAASHFLNQSVGVKDFDVWHFYLEDEKQRFPHRAKKRSPQEHQGKPVDFMKRTIPQRDYGTYGGQAGQVIMAYLQREDTLTKKLLLEKAIVGLFPEEIFGEVLWKGWFV